MASMGKIRGEQKVLVGKSVGKGSLARPRRRRVDDLISNKYVLRMWKGFSVRVFHFKNIFFCFQLKTPPPKSQTGKMPGPTSWI